MLLTDAFRNTVLNSAEAYRAWRLKEGQRFTTEDSYVTMVDFGIEGIMALIGSLSEYVAMSPHENLSLEVRAHHKHDLLTRLRGYLDAVEIGMTAQQASVAFSGDLGNTPKIASVCQQCHKPKKP